MLDFSELIFSSKAYNMVSLDTQLGRISHAYLFELHEKWKAITSFWNKTHLKIKIIDLDGKGI